jgi:hypothetical protein
MPSKITRSGTSFRGFIPSIKNPPSVPWHSWGEEGAALLLEFSPEVVHYRDAQDRQFQLGTISHPFSYTPDYEVTLRDGAIVFIEVKPAREARRPSVANRLALARAGLAERGFPLYVWDERITGAAIRRDTLRLLRPWRGRIARNEADEAHDLVARMQPRTFGGLIHLARTKTRALTWLANGAAGIDLDLPFLSTAEIFVDPPEMRHAQIFA